MASIDSHSIALLHQVDVGIIGASLAGIVAALELRDQGLSVLVIDRQAALAWECGWTFALPAGRSEAAGWRRLAAAWTAAGALHAGRIAGAQAEVESCGMLVDAGVQLLGQQTPVAIEHDGSGAIAGVVVAGKSGLGRVLAGRWLDASEDGELARLADAGLAPDEPPASRVVMAWQHPAWRTGDLVLSTPPGSRRLHLEPGRWDSERHLVLELPGAGAGHRGHWLGALQRLHEAIGGELQAGMASHASLLPLPLWAGGRPAEGAIAWRNLAVAVPGRCGLSDDSAAARAELGSAAARLCLQMAAAGPGCGRAELHPAAGPPAAVVVAGLGTGGAIAALAAARNGATVVACEPLPCAGGMGTAGGIHAYYFGVRGGLQDEVDGEVMRIRHLFGPPARQFGFHPLAKMAVLDRLLAEAGVQVVAGGTLAGATVVDGRIRDALVATPRGPLSLAAAAWIDATGDGDLAALAGAGFRLGRSSDAMLHAYTQSSGRCGVIDGAARMEYVNFDAGYCDPTDPADLTRARVGGILHYRRQRSDAWNRPTYIAPAIGLREGRLIDTDRILDIGDLLEGACDDDAIALHGAHLDAHAVDIHSESDQILLWIWGCRQWGRNRTACGIPYRCLLPVGLDNVWLASRCLGVSHDAHYSLRMQRDMQRIGEAAGIAAALAAAAGCGSRAVQAGTIRARLGPGAMQAVEDQQRSPFGWQQPGRFFGRALGPPADPAGREALFAQLDEPDDALDIRDADAGAGRPSPGLAMWRLYRCGQAAAPRLLALLDGDDRRSWRAAVVLAALGRSEATPRLLLAISRREDGFEDYTAERGPGTARSHLARNWIAALALLRLCAGWEALPVLAQAAGDPALPFDAAVALAATVARVAQRQPGPAPVAQVRPLLDGLLRRFGQGVLLPPHRTVNLPPDATLAAGRADMAEDHSWQLRLAVADAYRAVGLAMEARPDLRSLTSDGRAHVRRAAALRCRN
jgi:hypothetical protein